MILYKIQMKRWVGDVPITRGYVTSYSLLSRLHSAFFTRYKAGDFLFPHTDEPHGRIALVMHMTKDWLPWYGGSLVVMDTKDDPWPTTTKIKESFVPLFNTMHLMRIDMNLGPHYVHPVAPKVKTPRYAM